ncbi:hypothetical protein PPERSA_01212 [Pseudocohnilembus persalinus]|uniref:Uncharacterized protein n=1 Tax=Pseudocohnilembus persalinus TaxID=266149 RepID=A0A0V0R9Q3_PSEPJ|nr:hypothetical protein PPERSA_01212 [Pseudocohnilembus persalinus]|eukprot:KRX11013.1 hypothetical protein PPERSA_01212 [Pseudocohnilembus persalinus]
MGNCTQKTTTKTYITTQFQKKKEIYKSNSLSKFKRSSTQTVIQMEKTRSSLYSRNQRETKNEMQSLDSLAFIDKLSSLRGGITLRKEKQYKQNQKKLFISKIGSQKKSQNALNQSYIENQQGKIKLNNYKCMNSIQNNSEIKNNLDKQYLEIRKFRSQPYLNDVNTSSLIRKRNILQQQQYQTINQNNNICNSQISNIIDQDNKNNNNNIQSQENVEIFVDGNQQDFQKNYKQMRTSIQLQQQEKILFKIPNFPNSLNLIQAELSD